MFVIDGAITDVPGITVGHAQDVAAVTGCTVVLTPPQGAVVGAEVRGFAPGTRETDLARPGMLVERANAVLLSGGSAFGLDAAAGVMRFLRERGVGYDAGVARVPIVPGAVIFDLGIGQAEFPNAAMGYTACLAADRAPASGSVGAGTGATVGKLLGLAGATKSGVGMASLRVGGITVGSLVVVNALGDVVDPETGAILAGARLPDGAYLHTERAILAGAQPVRNGNTTIGVVATDARLDAEGVAHLARVAHNGLARTIRPVHTLYDGDTIFSLATGEAQEEGSLLALAVATVHAVQGAVINAVLSASSLGGVPARVNALESH